MEENTASVTNTVEKSSEKGNFTIPEEEEEQQQLEFNYEEDEDFLRIMSTLEENTSYTTYDYSSYTSVSTMGTSNDSQVMEDLRRYKILDDETEEYSTTTDSDHPCGCLNRPDTDIFPSHSEILYDELMNQQQYEGMDEKGDDSTETVTDFTDSDDSDKSLNPLILQWSFGVNLSVPILNLTEGHRKLVFLAASHKGIIYDYSKHDMTYVNGHANAIKSSCVDESGRWLATSDYGLNNSIIVTDILSRSTVLTITQESEESSVLLMAMSYNAKYLVTITKQEGININMFLWSFGADTPNDTYVYTGKKQLGEPKKIVFHPNAQKYIMIAFERQILFMKWSNSNTKFCQPVIPKIKKTLGTITDCTLVSECHECFASTTEGFIVIFGSSSYSEQFNEHRVINTKSFIKAIKVAKYAITTMTTVDGIIACTDSRGTIRFLDTGIKLLFWINNKHIPNIEQISFSLSARKYKFEDPFDFQNNIFRIESLKEFIEMSPEDRSDEFDVLYLNTVPSETSLEHKPFITRNFVAGCENGNVYYIDYVNNIYNPLFNVADSVVSAIDCSDEKNIPYTIIASALHLCMATSVGTIWFLDPLLNPINDKMPISVTIHTIKKVCYSPDAKYLALFDTNKTVYLLKHSHHSWEVIGKIRSHYKPLTDIIFVDTDLDPLKLCTIGEDRYLVEYDLDNGEEKIAIQSRLRIEQSALPLCFLHYTNKWHKDYLMVCNSQQKYKMFNMESRMCRSIVLGPANGCYGSLPLLKIMNLPGFIGRYMIFSNKSYIGIQKMPPDGNPYRYIGVKGNPHLLDFTISGDGNYIFTSGVEDTSVLMWEVHKECVDMLQRLGGVELEPFYCLIEGGVEGWFFKEMQDLFCYMQILHQGDMYHEQRFGESLALCELPDLMRACGYYLSEFQVDQALNDVKYRSFDETGQLRDDITFVEFVKLYINHRPANGITMDELQTHFEALKEQPSEVDCWYVNRSSDKETLVKKLCENGEAFKEITLHKCLKVMVHSHHRYMQSMAESHTELFSYLPDDIDFEYFTKELLGIMQDSLYEEMREREQQEILENDD
ncbi:PREDICTED: WD repeat-containing protein 66-like [Nicrophorus vespilloides]|uniref:WD repeat-containing protein 66-like n=1 Tax=Nicrophorus vespilloides TaxID=110193 RepID=A0ABM1M884_NICVS|nr:PREDICTED: WD repeat-containing protein 66-like [Nicrophorus vespilloides]